MNTTSFANDSIKNLCNQVQTPEISVNQLELTRMIVDAIFVIGITAMVLYFLWKLIELFTEKRENHKKRQFEERQKERQLLIDYRSKRLHYLEKGEPQDDDKFIQIIDTYITAQEKRVYPQ